MGFDSHQLNRSTFYLHYQNTNELLEESIGLLHERFLSYFANEPEKFIERISTCSTKELLLITPKYLVPYLTCVRDNKNVYFAAINSPTRFQSHATYLKMFEHVFDPILDRFGVPQWKRPYIMEGYLKGISAIVCEWINNGCDLPIESVTQLIVDFIPTAGE